MNTTQLIKDLQEYDHFLLAKIVNDKRVLDKFKTEKAELNAKIFCNDKLSSEEFNELEERYNEVMDFISEKVESIRKYTLQRERVSEMYEFLCHEE